HTIFSRDWSSDVCSSDLPLWVADVMVIDPDNPRAEIVGVKVASWDEPKTDVGKPVNFRNLRCMGYVAQGTNRVAYTFRADGLERSEERRVGKDKRSGKSP